MRRLITIPGCTSSQNAASPVTGKNLSEFVATVAENCGCIWSMNTAPRSSMVRCDITLPFRAPQGRTEHGSLRLRSLRQEEVEVRRRTRDDVLAHQLADALRRRG